MFKNTRLILIMSTLIAAQMCIPAYGMSTRLPQLFGRTATPATRMAMPALHIAKPIIMPQQINRSHQTKTSQPSFFTKMWNNLWGNKIARNTATIIGLTGITMPTTHAYLSTNIDAEKYPELTKFIKKYRCHQTIAKNAAKHFFKGENFDRIINAERMKKCIAKHNLYHLQVADKCLCDKDGFFNVLSQKVSFKPDEKNTKLSLSKTQQLVTLAEETGFRDWANNFNLDINKKLTFFDTESDSFLRGRVRGTEGIILPDDCKFKFFVNLIHRVQEMFLPNHCKFNFVVSLSIYRDQMEPEAQQWFDKKLNDLLHSYEGTKKATPLPFNEEYDDKIKFQQVKKELHELEEKFWSEWKISE